MLNNEYNLIINCVAASLGKNVSLPELGEVNYALFYKYSVSHSITPLVFDGAKKLGIELPEEVAARFIKNVRQYATQYILQDEQLQFLTYTFEKNGIKNMPLKGSILRKMYPRPELRTSSDIDILYDVDSDKKIGEIFLNNGYELGGVAAKDTSYVKRPFLNVEMHRTLMGDHPELEGDFADVWDRVKLVDGKRFSYKMTNEDFYVYMTSHAAKHYLMGGIGIRFVTDTWVFNKYVGDNLNRKEVNKRLDEMGVLTFDKNITLLAEYWFGNGDADNVILSLGDFICDCNTFGKVENRLATQLSENGSAGFVLRRIFLPYDIMCSIFPSLKGKKILLPFYWLRRIFRGMFNKNSKFYSENRLKSTINQEKIDSVKSLNDALGFKDKNIRY